MKEELSEREKRCLGMLLRSKLSDTFKTEDFIRKEMSKLSEESPIELCKDMLDKTYKVRNDCYEIARKLDIK